MANPWGVCAVFWFALALWPGSGIANLRVGVVFDSTENTSEGEDLVRMERRRKGEVRGNTGDATCGADA